VNGLDRLAADSGSERDLLTRPSTSVPSNYDTSLVGRDERTSGSGGTAPVVRTTEPCVGGAGRMAERESVGFLHDDVPYLRLGQVRPW